MYTATLFLGILNSIFVQPVVSEERAVLYRERAAGMYSVEPWYLAMVSPGCNFCILKHIFRQACDCNVTVTRHTFRLTRLHYNSI